MVIREDVRLSPGLLHIPPRVRVTSNDPASVTPSLALCSSPERSSAAHHPGSLPRDHHGATASTSCPLPRNLFVLRDAARSLLDALRYYGCVRGSAPNDGLDLSALVAPADVAASTAAELAVRSANLAEAQDAGADGAFVARPEPIAPAHVSAAFTISCRACALRLCAGKMTTVAGPCGSPLTLHNIGPRVSADGLAADVGSLALWVASLVEVRWKEDPDCGVDDASANDRAMAAARTPLHGVFPAAALHVVAP